MNAFAKASISIAVATLPVIGLIHTALWSRAAQDTQGHSTSLDPITGLPPDAPTNGPGVWNISIQLTNTTWQLTVLYDRAARWLLINKHLVIVSTNVTAKLFPQNPQIMCSFRFTNPPLYGRRMWQVDMNYEGNVKDCKEFRIAEGIPPGMTVPPPPPEQLR